MQLKTNTDFNRLMEVFFSKATTEIMFSAIRYNVV